jgi:N-acetylglucosamine kinase-like BadF-type ATPase
LKFKQPIVIIIADSGSTKTTWNMVDVGGNSSTVQTSGINPVYQDSDNILSLLTAELNEGSFQPTTIFFYGAGCINDSVNNIVHSVLEKFFNCSNITIGTDLLAAAHALCQDQPGIACILGTGSNSCYYNGRQIVNNVSPLGYVLGDEGSGAVMGKKLVADVLKNQLPEQIIEKFFKTYKLTPHEIIERVYKKPFPNRFLAQFTRFIYENLGDDSMRQLVKNSFAEFFSRNVSQYPEARAMEIHFTGSVAFYFAALLREVAVELGYRTGKITQSPSEDLIRYHLK